MVFETVRSVLFYLDTRQRSGGTIGSPDFTFPNNLINVKPQNGEKLRLTMQEASIEYTFFQTELFNNSFVVRESINNLNFQPDDPPVVTQQPVDQTIMLFGSRPAAARRTCGASCRRCWAWTPGCG